MVRALSSRGMGQPDLERPGERFEQSLDVGAHHGEEVALLRRVRAGRVDDAAHAEALEALGHLGQGLCFPDHDPSPVVAEVKSPKRNRSTTVRATRSALRSRLVTRSTTSSRMASHSARPSPPRGKDRCEPIDRRRHHVGMKSVGSVKPAKRDGLLGQQTLGIGSNGRSGVNHRRRHGSHDLPGFCPRSTDRISELDRGSRRFPGE